MPSVWVISLIVVSSVCDISLIVGNVKSACMAISAVSPKELMQSFLSMHTHALHIHTNLYLLGYEYVSMLL